MPPKSSKATGKQKVQEEQREDTLQAVASPPTAESERELTLQDFDRLLREAICPLYTGEASSRSFQRNLISPSLIRIIVCCLLQMFRLLSIR